AVGGTQTGAGFLDRHPISTEIGVIPGRLALEPTARSRGGSWSGIALRRGARLGRLGPAVGVAAPGGPERIRGVGALLCAGKGQGEREQDQSENRETSHEVPS